MAIDLGPLRRHQAFRRLFIGQTISTFGSEIAAVAAPFQLYELTHSTLQVGLLSICELVPLLTLTIVGGAIADAIDRRRLLLWTEALLALVSVGLALNASLDQPRVWALYVLATLSTSVGGPAIGGLLIAVAGISGAFWIDAGTFAASLWSVWMLPKLAPAPDADRPSVRSIVEGFRFLVSKKVLLGMFLTDSNAMVFGMPRALFPALANKFGGGAGIVGLLYAAPYAGALLASLLSGWIAHVRRQGLVVAVAAGFWGVFIIGFGFAESLWMALLFLGAAGAADNVSAVMRQTILFSVTPDRLRGRLSGIEFAQVASTPALGNLEAGVVASLTSLRFSIVSGGILCVVGTLLIAALFPAFVRYDAKEARDAAPA